MLLSDRDIAAEIKAGRVQVEPFEAKMIQPSSVDVRPVSYTHLTLPTNREV